MFTREARESRLSITVKVNAARKAGESLFYSSYKEITQGLNAAQRYRHWKRENLRVGGEAVDPY